MSDLIYHLVPAAHWHAALNIYFPETYEQDGFTHCTSGRERLMEVANHFYRDSAGDWLCLEMSVQSVEAEGVRVRFEAAAPVGDQSGTFEMEVESFGESDGESQPVNSAEILFPHLYGGIPRASVLATYPVTRAADGSFLGVGASPL